MKNKNLNAVHVSKQFAEGRAEARPCKARATTRKNEAPGAQCSSSKKSGSEAAALQIWKQFEDSLIPQLRLSVHERAVYSHLLRHSRLEGKQQLRFSILWLATSAGLSIGTARKTVRSLVAKGAMRLAERSKMGHLVEVRLPEEIPAVRVDAVADRGAAPASGVDDLEAADFLASQALREAIHAREGGKCFYCLRRMSPTTRCLDHVVPRVLMGGNSYRNLVSCCSECNSLKGEQRAEDFVRWLFRDGRLSSAELKGRLSALEALAAGKLRPVIPSESPEPKVRR
jgi:hypothetical protein